MSLEPGELDRHEETRSAGPRHWSGSWTRRRWCKRSTRDEPSPTWRGRWRGCRRTSSEPPSQPDWLCNCSCWRDSADWSHQSRRRLETFSTVPFELFVNLELKNFCLWFLVGFCVMWRQLPAWCPCGDVSFLELGEIVEGENIRLGDRLGDKLGLT